MVSQQEYNEFERKTKLLKLKNIRFCKGRGQLDVKRDDIQSADCMSITFPFQKNLQKEDMVTQHCMGKFLCSVKAAADLILCILAYPSTNMNSCTNLVRVKYKNCAVKSKMVRDQIWVVVLAIGKDTLGIIANEVGTHFVRASMAMALCLANVKTYIIMLIECWLSDGFMKYIQRQIQEFSSGLTTHAQNA